MLNTKITKQDVEDRVKKGKMTTKQALSMQATIQNAMANRSPRNPDTQVGSMSTPNGFGRTT